MLNDNEEKPIMSSPAKNSKQKVKENKKDIPEQEIVNKPTHDKETQEEQQNGTCIVQYIPQLPL